MSYELTDWSREYPLDLFQEQAEAPPPASLKGAVAGPTQVVIVALEELPASVLLFTKSLIELGDHPERPRGSGEQHFKSRSEAVFRVGIDLAEAGCSEEVIAGILMNPAYRISESILEQRDPERAARRVAVRVHAAVSGGWPDSDRNGRPKSTMRNALAGFRRLDLHFSHDLFRHRKLINGVMLGEHEGEISDDACATLRGLFIEEFNFDPGAENIRDAVNQLCLENPFHPIRAMIGGLVWDGVPRVRRWLINFMGADDTPLNEAVGTILLTAAIRRIREPGVKFDTIVILEGRQGSGKSTALQILAGPGNHSDNEILTQDTKGQMEAMEGVWIYELSELSGMSKSEAEKVKAFASRTVDKARMAYGRFSESRPRQTIFVGTTNEAKYLKDRTGNRRFLPVKTGTIDLEALRRDRDQLLAEAAELEAQGESIELSKDLWAVAAIEQEDRLEDDPWLELLVDVRGKAAGEAVRVSSYYLLAEVLMIEAERQHNGHTKRLAALMLSLGWMRAKWKISKKTVRGFARPKPPDHVDDQPRELLGPWKMDVDGGGGGSGTSPRRGGA